MTSSPPLDPNPMNVMGADSAMLAILDCETNTHLQFWDAQLFVTILGISSAYLHLGITHFPLIDVQRGLDQRDMLHDILLLADASIYASISIFTMKDIGFTRVHSMMIGANTLLAHLNRTFPAWHDNDNIWDENVSKFNSSDFIAKKWLIGAKLTTNKQINLEHEEDITHFGIVLNMEIDW